VTAIALTGISGAGKSTLAALTYQYAEKQRRTGHGPFLAESLWLGVDASVTMDDLAGSTQTHLVSVTLRSDTLQ
jgi:ABC-type glutathione transport system ATPase component